jgi:hypothetical protein
MANQYNYDSTMPFEQANETINDLSFAAQRNREISSNTKGSLFSSIKKKNSSGNIERLVHQNSMERKRDRDSFRPIKENYVRIDEETQEKTEITAVIQLERKLDETNRGNIYSSPFVAPLWATAVPSSPVLFRPKTEQTTVVKERFIDNSVSECVIEVSPDSNPADFQKEIEIDRKWLCLHVTEGKFDIKTAIEWVKSAKDFTRPLTGVLLKQLVIADFSQLKPQDIIEGRLSFSQNNALFIRYLKGQGFEETFNNFAAKIEAARKEGTKTKVAG